MRYDRVKRGDEQWDKKRRREKPRRPRKLLYESFSTIKLSPDERRRKAKLQRLREFWYNEKPRRQTRRNINNKQEQEKDEKINCCRNMTTRNYHKTAISINQQAHPGKTCQPGNESCGWAHSSWCGSGAGCTAALPHWPAPSAGTCVRGARGPIAVGSTCVSQGLQLEALCRDPPQQYWVQPGHLPLLLLHPRIHHQLLRAAAAERPWEIKEAQTC